MITLLALLMGCVETHDHVHPHGADHAHGHDEAHDHGHGPAEAPAAEPQGDGDADAAEEGGEAAIEAPLGDHRARLEPSADRLKMVVLDPAGQPIPPSGPAKVVLTGVGEDEQRIELKAGADGWSGAAKAAGAKGYTAVISVGIDGVKQVAKITWGDVPKAGHGHAHPHGEAGHAHGHGADGHTHD